MRNFEIGADYIGYRNHVYRMINFCFAQQSFSDKDRQKIIIAGCFHDLGIWSNQTFDYLLPSVERAEDYLLKNKLDESIPVVKLMIETHHKLREYSSPHGNLVEAFRKGDLVDFSLGFIKCGLPKTYIKNVRVHFPNAGFHKCLLRLAGRWVIQHPLNPVPVLKW